MNMEKLCRIRDIQRSIAEFERGFEKRYAICLNEGMLLCSLRRGERMSSGELGGALGLTSSNVSKVIAQVERKGYVYRMCGGSDKRQMHFTLTDSGCELLYRIGRDEIEFSDLLRSLVELE